MISATATEAARTPVPEVFLAVRACDSWTVVSVAQAQPPVPLRETGLHCRDAESPGPAQAIGSLALVLSGKRDSPAQRQMAQNRLRAGKSLRGDRTAYVKARQLRAFGFVATSTRRFTIGGPDGVLAVVLPPLLVDLRRLAPNIDINVRQLLPPHGSNTFERAWQAALADLEARAITPARIAPAWTAQKTVRFLVSRGTCHLCKFGRHVTASSSSSRCCLL